MIMQSAKLYAATGHVQSFAQTKNTLKERQLPTIRSRHADVGLVGETYRSQEDGKFLCELRCAVDVS